ncbi:MAG: uroporphyrinogen-III synthase [Proteobacteria bacterium]|nr:uroporphyrinogen-III synthase [Pseudomonadota bacterium]
MKSLYINTRSVKQSAGLTSLLLTKAAEVLELPLLEMKEAEGIKELADEIASIDWILFTSANAVDIFYDYIQRNNILLPETVRFAAIADKTAKVISEKSLNLEFVSSNADARSFATEFVKFLTDNQQSEKKVLLLRGDKADPSIVDIFLASEIKVRDLIIYQTVFNQLEEEKKEKLLSLIIGPKQRDLVFIFTSGSSFDALIFNLSNNLRMQPEKMKLFIDDCSLAAIGPKTAEHIQSKGYVAKFVAPEQSVESLVKTLFEV